MGYARRVDTNHADIMKALRTVGWLVFDTSRVGGGFPDLVASRGGVVRFIEVKVGRGRLTDDQTKFIDQGWPVTVIRTIDEALTL